MMPNFLFLRSVGGLWFHASVLRSRTVRKRSWESFKWSKGYSSAFNSFGVLRSWIHISFCQRQIRINDLLLFRPEDSFVQHNLVVHSSLEIPADQQEALCGTALEFGGTEHLQKRIQICGFQFQTLTGLSCVENLRPASGSTDGFLEGVFYLHTIITLILMSLIGTINKIQVKDSDLCGIIGFGILGFLRRVRTNRSGSTHVCLSSFLWVDEFICADMFRH